jgi:hypothetical protein
VQLIEVIEAKKRYGVFSTEGAAESKQNSTGNGDDDLVCVTVVM